MTVLATDPPLANPLTRLFADAPLFTAAGLFLAALTIPTLAAMGLEDRLFQGLNPWAKPLKFELSLALYLLTLAACARLLPESVTAHPAFRPFNVVVVACIAYEIVWIGNAARLDIGSHFNTATPLTAAAYGLAGLGAVILTSASLVWGLAIFRPAAPPLTQAIGLSLILTFVLTLAVAGTMSSGTSHFVGTPVTDATLPLLGWSREVGDLRVPHFFATHAMQIVPAGALVATLTLPTALHRPAILAGTVAYTAFTIFTFAQALAGKPFL